MQARPTPRDARAAECALVLAVAPRLPVHVDAAAPGHRRSVLPQHALIDAALAETPATLCPFDLLARDDEDLRPLRLVERKARLYRSVQDGAGERSNKQRFWDAAISSAPTRV